MTDLVEERKNIQLEESRFKFAVSESWNQKIGKAINFINKRQHSEKQFFLNGYYNILTVPYLGVDGLVVFNFDAEIINAYAWILQIGTGGTTELDIKKATAPGSAFSSIFSTTPKFTSAAANYSWVGVGDVVTGATAPVMSPLNANGYLSVDAGDALRFDLISAMTGTTTAGPRSCGVNLHYRPR
jgi:hypothetical protein